MPEPAFIGFAIGESLGASALRICGGIFTKIADIGSDLMKIVFNIKEDDPRNPGVIADCTGDNAGDSVGPTADGFETYGVTGVARSALSSWPSLQKYQAELITWIFVMRILMILTSIGCVLDQQGDHRLPCTGKRKKFDFEVPLTSLVWMTSILSIVVTFASATGSSGIFPTRSVVQALDHYQLRDPCRGLYPGTGEGIYQLKVRSLPGGGDRRPGRRSIPGYPFRFCGRKFQRLLARHRDHRSNVNRLTWPVPFGLDNFMDYSSIFAFGLVAFGFLGMGPVTIAVDSYGPVTDNAQSIYELSLIETIPNIAAEIENDFGFKPNFDTAKQYLEENDSCRQHL